MSGACDATDPEGLRRLAHKYRTLAELRRAKARGEPEPPRAVFRQLAREFPGALRELDRLALDEIDRRADALTRAADGAVVLPWMHWMLWHHALFRAALYVKARLARAREVDDETAHELARAASDASGANVDVAFVRAVARPPGGRIANVVFAWMSSALGVDAHTLHAALDPPRLPRNAV